MVKTVVTVIGVADRSQGTSNKTGKHFDFVKVAFQYINPFDRADVCVSFIDGNFFDKRPLVVGDKFEAVVATFGNKVSVELLDPVY